MAVIGASYTTLADWARNKDPDGSLPKIVEMFAESNPMIQSLPAVASNQPISHVTTIRGGLPDVTWRMFYEGVQPSKSTVVQVTDHLGELVAYSKVDASLAELNGATAEFRLAEQTPFLQAMNNEVGRVFFYGDRTTNPKEFHGLAPRYPYKDSPNVIDAAGTGTDLTSAWLICAGEMTCHLLFAKGQVAGLKHTDKTPSGPETTSAPDGDGDFEAYIDHYKWVIGMCVRDWRAVVRICNLETTGSSNLITKELMIQAINQIPKEVRMMGRLMFFVAPALKTFLDLELVTQTNLALSIGKWYGKPVTEFWGYPVLECDALSTSETALVATP